MKNALVHSATLSDLISLLGNSATELLIRSPFFKTLKNGGHRTNLINSHICKYICEMFADYLLLQIPLIGYHVLVLKFDDTSF